MEKLPFQIKKRWNLSKIVLLRCFSTIRMLTIIPKYHGGTMSRCTVLDLCPTVRHLQLFDVMLWWCNRIIKWSHICFKVVPIVKMIFPHWKPTFGGLYQAVRSKLWFSVQCDILLKNWFSDVFLTINEMVWTFPSKYVILYMKPLKYSWFGHKKSFFTLKPWIIPKPYSVTFMLAHFLKSL